MKKTIRIIVSLLVLVMTLCVFAGCTEQPADTTPSDTQATEPTKPVDLNLDVYYNKTHVKALAADETDGTFHMTLYNKSKSITVRAKDEAVAKKILAATTMLLVKDDQGVVTDIQMVEDVSGKLVAAGSYVSAVDGNKVSITSGTFGGGWDLGTFEMAANCNITDTTGGSTVGATMKLRENDQIYAVANANGEIKQVFIVARTSEQKVAYCEHCEKDVVWTAHYADKGVMPTAAGHWYLTGNMTAKASTSTATSDVVVDLNGYTVSTVPEAQLYILNNAKTVLHLMDSSEAKTGAIVAATNSNITAAGGLIDVGIAGAKFVLYSGTLDATGLISSQTGAGIYVVKGAFFEMKGGKIIGGTVVGAIDSSGSDAGGRGGALNLAAGSETTISGGEIVGGKAILGDTQSKRAQGGAVYLYKGAKFTMTGGKISGGEAALGGDCFYAESEADMAGFTGGEIEKIDYKA